MNAYSVVVDVYIFWVYGLGNCGLLASDQRPVLCVLCVGLSLSQKETLRHWLQVLLSSVLNTSSSIILLPYSLHTICFSWNTITSTELKRTLLLLLFKLPRVLLNAGPTMGEGICHPFRRNRSHLEEADDIGTLQP